MTTATQTRNAVANNAPVINVARSTAGVNVAETATMFTNDNLRHIVNRRMRWSSTEQFVRQALHSLAGEVNNRALGNSSMRPTMNVVVDRVRDAANRRRAWATVNDVIEGAVRDVIDAARRCC